MKKDSGKVLIHGKEYSTVALRVQKFREEYETKYSLQSKLVSADKDTVVVRAFIRDLTKEGYPEVASGYAEEKRAASMINKTSALENCETSAYGRALAAFGLAGTEFASADEVANAIQQQNSPEKEYNPAREEQEKKIKALAAMLGYPDKVVEAKLNTIKSSDDAKTMIGNLEELLKKQAEESPEEPF